MDMFEDYLCDTCDIYHLTDGAVSAGNGINASNVKKWQETPGLAGVPCHFHVTHDNLQIVQAEPQSELQGDMKLSLGPEVDIRKNDLVISGESESIEPGLRFRADTPRTIHNGHHITVILRREEGIKGAI